MRASHSMAVLAVCLAACVARPSDLRAADLPVHVVVHPTRAGSLTIGEVRAIFLKQQILWSDGQPIVPVNREAESEARESFSRHVFGQGSRQMAAYWNRRYFEAGEFPPATLASEEAVVRFVAANANAIGYVVGADTGAASVAVVLVLGGSAPTQSPVEPRRGPD